MRRFLIYMTRVLDADSAGERPRDIARTRINPSIMMDELSRSNAAVFGDLCRDLASPVCHFGQEYMAVGRRITHEKEREKGGERDINDITLECEIE